MKNFRVVAKLKSLYMIDSKPSLENSIVNLEAKQFLESPHDSNMSVTSHQRQASNFQSNPKYT